MKPQPTLMLAAALLLGVLLSGCDRAPDPSTASVPQQWMQYPTRGIIQRIEQDGRHVRIAHDEIPGYMAAMTMEFTAADAPELSGLQPGDEVTFTLNVGEKESFIDTVHKTGRKGDVADSATTNLSTVPPGTELPDTQLVDEIGTPFRLTDLRGKAVAITFIFTRCPLPDFCPRMSMHFAEVRKELTSAVPAEKWRLLSVSIDPEYDTPERLHDYAGRYGSERSGWIFATGTAESIRQLTSSTGLTVGGEAPMLNHNLRTIVVDPSGKVARVFPGNEWTPAELTAEIQRALATPPGSGAAK